MTKKITVCFEGCGATLCCGSELLIIRLQGGKATAKAVEKQKRKNFTAVAVKSLKVCRRETQYIRG